jgi:hypothetical protein
LFAINKEYHKGIQETIGKSLGAEYKFHEYDSGPDAYFLLKVHRQYKHGLYEGIYNGVPFRIFLLGQYSAVEFLDKHKFYGFIILTRDFPELRLNGYLLKDYHVAQLEGLEFNQKFLVYAKNIRDIFYDLDPDSMHKLLEVRKKYYQIGIEAKNDRVLVYTFGQVFDKSIIEKAFLVNEALK